MSNRIDLDGLDRHEIIGGVTTLSDGYNYEIIGGVTTLSDGYNYEISFIEKLPLSSYNPGDILWIRENSILTPFYVAKHNYEPELNGHGRTLVVRKYAVDEFSDYVWLTKNGAGDYYPDDYYIYINSVLHKHTMNNYYLSRLSDTAKTAIGNTTIRYLTEKSTDIVSCPIFSLSSNEITGNHADDGEYLGDEISKLLKIYTTSAGVPVSQWTRTGRSNIAVMISSSGYVQDVSSNTGQRNIYSRPAFTLPDDALVYPLDPDRPEIMI